LLVILEYFNDARCHERKKKSGMLTKATDLTTELSWFEFKQATNIFLFF